MTFDPDGTLRVLAETSEPKGDVGSFDSHAGLKDATLGAAGELKDPVVEFDYRAEGPLTDVGAADIVGAAFRSTTGLLSTWWRVTITEQIATGGQAYRQAGRAVVDTVSELTTPGASVLGNALKIGAAVAVSLAVIAIVVKVAK